MIHYRLGAISTDVSRLIVFSVVFRTIFHILDVVAVGIIPVILFDVFLHHQ